VTTDVIGVPAVRGLVARLRVDPLVSNSIFLMGTTALSAASGFVFWIVVARLYPVTSVGQATSLLSVMTLLCYFSQFGLSSSLVRYLPTTQRRSAHVESALTSVAVTGTLVAFGFALLIPVTSPELGFVTSAPWRIVLFAMLAMCAAQNLLTDSVFIALRAARYNLFVDGLLMGLVKLSLPVLLVSMGAMGIFVANTAASAVAALASVVLIRRSLGIRLRPRVSWDVLRTTMRFSAGNYVSSCLNLVPLLVIPLLILHRLGAVPAAAYFVAFQIANLVNAVPFAIGEALFAEGSHEQEGLRKLATRSAVLTLALTVPAVAGAAGLAHPVLVLFGHDYARDAQGTLVVLAVSALPVAFNTWSSFLLKVTSQLTAMTVSNAVYAAATVVLAIIASGHGLVWIAAAWGVGNLLSGAVALVALAVRPGAQPQPGVADTMWPPMRGVLLSAKEER
jgi:O-antigen/teichoic acid export membrane protein